MTDIVCIGLFPYYARYVRSGCYRILFLPRINIPHNKWNLILVMIDCLIPVSVTILIWVYPCYRMKLIGLKLYW